MTIYFAEAGGRIKIGYTKAEDPTRRLRQISVSLGIELQTIGVMSGYVDFERFIFEALKQYRTGGEWFEDRPEVRAFIQQAISGGPEGVGFQERRRDTPTLYVPIERTDEEYFVMFAGLVTMIWPHDGIRELAAFVERPESEVRAWLNGEVMPPRVVRFAFAALVSQYAFGITKPSFARGGDPPTGATSPDGKITQEE